ncbi:unnamed protein product, partial [Mesorhabditis belari]|uniref:Uncharacterized protein n=1 Tax=Mesorhabditis belari TaxID=2138241 RepID=A0AAF3FRY6_9BILA
MRFLLTLCWLLVLSLAGSVQRSKRQVSVYYLCPGNNGGYVSQYPCSNNCGNNNCNYNNNYNNNNYNYNYNNGCYGGTNCNYPAQSLPYSFYNSGYNCNTGCSNVNCGNYQGTTINGQYVAYSPFNNQYSACASNCCNNYYNPYTNNDNNFVNTWGNNGNVVDPNAPIVGEGVSVAARSPTVPLVAPDLSASIRATKG